MIDASAAAIIRGIGGRVLTFGECLRFAPEKGFEPLAPPSTLFAREIDRLKSSDDDVIRPVMDLPAGASWGDLKFAFVSNTCSTSGTASGPRSASNRICLA